MRRRVSSLSAFALSRSLPRLSRPAWRGPAMLVVTVVAWVAAWGSLALAESFDPSQARMVDLTHPFNSHTIYWPTSPWNFGYTTMFKGIAKGGWYYSAGAFQAPEHGGTHMDAPVHFKEGGATADRVPLDRLIAPVVVIDVTKGAIASSDYEVQLSDIMAFEMRYGPITKGTIVLARTGWSSRWDNKKEYLGDDRTGVVTALRFPGFGAEAMRVLVEQRGVAAVGLDTASLDPGVSTEFEAHRIAAAGGVPGFENLTNLDQVPARGAWLIALPMMIENGSGGPLRAVAMIPAGR